MNTENIFPIPKIEHDFDEQAVINSTYSQWLPTGLAHTLRVLFLVAALSVCFRKCNNAGTYDPDTCPTPSNSISEYSGFGEQSVVVYQANQLPV